MHRKGQLLLVLILPDGSKSLIPADWTDLASPIQIFSAAGATATLGSLENLLHARAVVDALLGRLAPVTGEDGNFAATKESACARKKPKPLRSSPRRNLPWETLHAEHQNLAIQILARLIVQATLGGEEKAKNYE